MTDNLSTTSELYRSTYADFIRTANQIDLLSLLDDEESAAELTALRHTSDRLTAELLTLENQLTAEEAEAIQAELEDSIPND